MRNNVSNALLVLGFIQNVFREYGLYLEMNVSEMDADIL
jgi:hypothetical protein